MRRHGWMTQVLAVTLAWLFLVAESLAVAGTPQLPNPGSAPLSREQQIQLGQKALGEVYQQMPVLPDSSPIVQYVQQLGRKLDTQIPQQYNWPYQFHVVQQKEINAFAIPGGPIFINVGTITSAANEAQLAGVIAHEMSHVYMQHSAKQMKQNVGPSIIAGLGQILGQMVGGIGGAVASIGGQMAGGLMSMKYSRADEAQADAVGAIIMYKAGYDPKQMALFFQTLEKEGGAGGPQFLSDHPNPGNRYAAITNEVRDWPAKNYTVNSPAFTTAKQQAGGIKAYTAQEIANGAKSGEWQRQNQQSGSVPKNVSMNTGNGQQGANGSAASDGSLANVTYSQVRPSGNFKQENDQVLSIAYPDNWQVMPDSQGGGLTIAPQAGVSQGSVAYGVVIGGTSDTNVSLDSGTQSLLQDMEKSQGLRADGSPESITVNGAQARSLYLTGTSPVQQNGKAVQERDWLVTVERPQGGIIYVVFVAPQPEFSQLQPTYEHMLKTLHVK